MGPLIGQSRVIYTTILDHEGIQFRRETISILIDVSLLHCYKAKNNFRMMNIGNQLIQLTFNSVETEHHIFQSCNVILEKLGIKEIPF